MNDRLEIASRLLAGDFANPESTASTKECVKMALDAADELIRQEEVLTKEESERTEREYLREQIEFFNEHGFTTLEKIQARFYELDKKFNQETQ